MLRLAPLILLVSCSTVARVDDTLDWLKDERSKLDAAIERAGEATAAATRLITAATPAVESLRAALDAARDVIVRIGGSLAHVSEDAAAVTADVRSVVGGFKERMESARTGPAPLDGSAVDLAMWAVAHPWQAVSCAGGVLAIVVRMIVAWRAARRRGEALGAVAHIVERLPEAHREALLGRMQEAYGGCPVVTGEIRRAKRKPAPRHVPGALRRVAA